MATGDRATVVMLHGFTHTGASWSPVLAELGEGRYTAIAPDIRGHGAASEAEPVTLEAVIGDLDALTRERFILVGYSMGGRIALHVALALAERVERLVVIGASPGIADRTEREARRRADERLSVELGRLDIEELARRWAATPVLADQPDEVAAAVHEDRLRNTPQGLVRAMRGLGTGTLPSLWDRLGELVMPVALVAGERDPRFTAIAARMATRIRTARIVIVPGAGHAVHLEAPERIASVIAAPR